MTKQNRIHLDRTKLLGFKLDPTAPAATGNARSKMGAKFGVKLGGKAGAKPPARA